MYPNERDNSRSSTATQKRSSPTVLITILSSIGCINQREAALETASVRHGVHKKGLAARFCESAALFHARGEYHRKDGQRAELSWKRARVRGQRDDVVCFVRTRAQRLG